MSVLSATEAAQDRRFNAVKQNFTGEHIIADDSQRERYQAALERFTKQYKPEGNPTIEFLVSEVTKSTWQIERIEAVIAKTIAEKGDLCDELRLLNRYLNEHRRNFYRAIKQITDLRRQSFQETRLGFKMEVETPLAQFEAQTRRISVAGKSSETKLFEGDVKGINSLREMIRFASANASQ